MNNHSFANRNASCQRSYSAGAFTHNAEGFREVSNEDTTTKLKQLMQAFPELSEWIVGRLTVISAYPAALGLSGVGIFIDTYLRPSTTIRAMRCAAIENSRVLFAAQPLAGADMLLKYYNEEYELPTNILWASGGYYLPISLENFLRDLLATRGCKLQVLHCYGSAEIGHTVFAAMERFDCGQPQYKLIDDQVSLVSGKHGHGIFSMRRGDVEVACEDQLVESDSFWRITSSPKRLDPRVRELLESWTGYEWSRRTGYLSGTQNARSGELSFDIQLREPIRFGNARESRFHEFWQKYGGDLSCKPQWSIR